jgi:hypothetical protein
MHGAGWFSGSCPVSGSRLADWLAEPHKVGFSANSANGRWLALAVFSHFQPLWQVLSCRHLPLVGWSKVVQFDHFGPYSTSNPIAVSDA